MQTPDTEGYIPGTCNIGPAEIKRRNRNGYLGLAISLLLILSLEIFSLPLSYTFLLVVPLSYSFMGFLQARHKFCLLYGWMGIVSLTDRKRKIADKERDMRRSDRATALKLFTQTIALALICTVLYFFLRKLFF